jgi:TPR repeat protein
MGKGVAQDQVEAVDWFRKAAAQGSGEAEYNLGKCCQDGLGVEMDPAEAFKWFRAAADKGLPQSAFELALCCFYGRGTEADYVEAYTRMSMAASRAIPTSAEMLKDWKSEMSPEQIAAGDRRVAELAQSQPKAPVEELDFEDEVEAKFPVA